MAGKKKQYPKVVDLIWEPTHFTREQCERAVQKAWEEEERRSAEERRLRRAARRTSARPDSEP